MLQSTLLEIAMRWLPVAVCGAALSIAGCSDGGSGGVGAEPVEIRMDTLNAAIVGSFSLYNEERREALHGALAEAETDIICLQEVWDSADKEMLREDVAAEFPWVVWFETDIDTEVDDPRDQNGDIPPPRTTVPCSDEVEVGEGETVADQMTRAIDCARDACSTIPGSDDGYTASIDCAIGECLGTISPLLMGGEEQLRCYGCLTRQLPDETYGTIRESCQTLVNAEFSARGQNGMMLLSRYPLKDMSRWVLPATWSRRIVLSATAELPNGSEIDLHCNHLIAIPRSPISLVTTPYIGPYGDGHTGVEAWEAEQRLSAQRLIERVEMLSKDRPAIVLGDLNAGHAYPEHAVFAEIESTLELLESVFTPAYSDDYIPLCTFCDTNPLNDFDPERSRWIDHILMYNLPAEAVKETERTFDDDEAVDVGGGVKVSLSDHYGMRSVIEVP